MALPYLPVGGAIVAVVLARRPTGQTPHLVFVGMMALLGVLALRQGLAANENLRLVARLRRLAYSDQLTGLPNRLTFNRRLRRALRDDAPVAVLLLDLDGFKQVNDRFGHATGDRLLTGIAERMRDAIGGDGMIARLGGDEFAVLVDGDRPVPPERLAERLLAALRAAADGEEDLGVHPSASIGIAEYGPQHASHTDLLRDADIAMYAAKAAGKSAYRTCTPALRESAVTRAELIADLRRAVDEGQLHLEYQPIVDLATGAVRSAEALVRWRHPRLGVLTPARFLPLAEETGLILPIDRWVIHEACRAAATWRERAPEATVAVNIAAAHLRRPDLIATVTAATAARRPATARAHPGADRVGADRGQRRGAGPAAPAARAGHRDRHRRLRHRLLVAELPAPDPGHRAEDRPVVRGPARARRRPGVRHGGDGQPARRRVRPGGGGRGGGDRARSTRRSPRSAACTARAGGTADRPPCRSC